MIGRRWFTPWLFLLPALAILGIFYWWPIANTMVLAFTDAHAIRGGSFNGLENFKRLFSDELFVNSLRNSFLFMIGVVPALVLLPLLLAVLANAKLPGMGFFRTVFFSPVVASMVVAALLCLWMLCTDDRVNWVFARLRVIYDSLGWLSDSKLALISVMVVTVWKGLGYYMIFYLAGLQNIPTQLYEAVKLDGANAIRSF